jgi:hypothetical protein
MPTYYINPAGNDTTGTGTSGNPWKTISKAHTSAASGDTIICQDSVATYTLANQTFSKSLTIQGESDDASGAVFDGGAAAVKWTVPDNLALVFEKITLTNTDQGASGKGLFDRQGGTINLTLNDCILHKLYGANGFGSTILNIQSSAQGTVTFTNCLIRDIDAPNAGQGGAIRMWDVSSGAGVTLTITGCTFYFGSKTITALFNTNGGAKAQTIIKNTIMYHDTSGVFQVGSGVYTATYDCFYQMTSAPSGTGVITSDPLFVDLANLNLNLRPTSPCIDSAILV